MGWIVMAAVSATAAGMAQPVTLKSEYKVSPLGIESPAPRLTWQVVSSRRGEKQTAYQILVASSEKALKSDQGDLWDSGKVASDQTAHIVYGGKPLTSGERAFWKVRVWDRDGSPSDYSKPAFWEMGLLSRDDWKGQWIGQAAASSARTHNGYHSQFAPNADTEKWVQVDLGKTQEIDSVRLFPARPFDWHADIPGTFYPVRFKVEVAETPDFASPQVVVNKTDADLPNPGTEAPRYSFAKTQARYVRATATKLRDREGKEYALALAELQVLNGDTNAALNAPVTATDSVEGNSWSHTKLTDGDLTSHPAGESAPAPYLRKTFTAEKDIKAARLYVSAKGLYRLHINGKRVGNDIFTPGWTDYRKRIQYQTYDVTRLLQKGQNAIGMVLGDGWYCGHVGLTGKGNYGPAPRALAQIEITHTDGSKQLVVTDESWSTSGGPIQTNDLLMGETYDARKEMPGWDTPKFADTSWKPAVAETLDYVAPSTLAPQPGHAPLLVASASPTVQQYTEIKPKTISEKPAGAYIFDLGQNMVGWARLKVKGAAGATVRLRFAEMLNPDGSIYTTNLRGAKATDYYTLKGDAKGEVYEPTFTFHGFRYVELTGYPGKPTKDAVTGVVVTSATPVTGTFACSNPMVNQLQHNITWGQIGNYLEAPTDCPQRDERLGWMGDAQIFVRTACFNRDVAGFMTKWTQDVVDAQSPEGGFSDVSPRIGDMSDGAPAWGDAGVIVPWTIYLCYGDKRILETHYDAMAKWIEYIRSANPRYLLWKNRSNNNFGDWLNIDADMPRDILATSYFAYSTSLVAKIARILGKPDAEKYEQLFERIKDMYNMAYVRPDGRIMTQDGKGDTQTCYLLALRFNLLPENIRPLAAQHLIEDVVEKRKNHLSTGFVGVGYLTPTLTDIGRVDVAYKLLQNDTFPSWGYSIKYGATTIWERWDGWTAEKGFQDPGMNSFNHYSLGSVGEWMYHTVAGIDLDPAQPGYKHIVLHPQPGGGLTYAKASYDSLHGRIVSDWKLSKGGLTWKVVIPANTTATVRVPTSDVRSVRESGNPITQVEGVTFLRSENGAAVYEVGSGEYTFTAKP